MKSNRLQSFSSNAFCSGDGGGVETSSTAEDTLDDDVKSSGSLVFCVEAVVDNLSSNTSDASCCSSSIVILRNGEIVQSQGWVSSAQSLSAMMEVE